MIVLGEHAFPDRFRLRPVHFGGELYVMYAGAQLGGLDSGRDALWRWLACQRMRPPLEQHVNAWRQAVGESVPTRRMWRQLIATYGIRWGEVSAGTAGWQLARVDGVPEWLEERLFSGAWDEDRMDRFRRSIVSEDVTRMRSAMAAVAMYEDRAKEGPWQPAQA